MGRGANPSAKVRQRLSHVGNELVASALIEQQSRMSAVEGFDHHQLGAQQPDAVDVERGCASHLRWFREVEQKRGPRHWRARGDRGGCTCDWWRSDHALEDEPTGRVDGDQLAVGKNLGCPPVSPPRTGPRARARRSLRGR